MFVAITCDVTLRVETFTSWTNADPNGAAGCPMFEEPATFGRRFPVIDTVEFVTMRLP